MANVAKYNREEVIHKAMLLFWQKGFHATSTRDLQQAVDMRPGSIYAAFGGKESMYKEALNYYLQVVSEGLRAEIERQGQPMAGLKAFFKGALLDPAVGAPGQMCMLVKTISELDEDYKALKTQARNALKAMENLFAELIADGQVCGEVADHFVPQQAARHLQVQLIGLRSYYHSTRDETAVHEVLDDIFNAFADKTRG